MDNLITKVELQKRNKNRVNIYVNEEFLFACSAEIIYRYNLKAGKNIDIPIIEKIIEEDNYIKCKNDSLRFMERSFKTEKQIYDKLLGKGYDNKTIEKVINSLKEYNLIDDSKYVEMYIKEKSKSEGKNKIKYSLLQKGIDENIVRQKLENMDSNIEAEALVKIAENKYNQLVKREEDKRKLYKKLGDFLIRKGYSFDDIKPILNKLINNNDW
ncbi:recombination regulator RecX [Clostridium lundense]|uniref:recombination regulator RecX n=1 Tax=Clostridium lundense TaxID=319475 RepID=UPI000483FACF|nr:recombination regulator RecX [Clostridium lundense]